MLLESDQVSADRSNLIYCLVIIPSIQSDFRWSPKNVVKYEVLEKKRKKSLVHTSRYRKLFSFCHVLRSRSFTITELHALISTTAPVFARSSIPEHRAHSQRIGNADNYLHKVPLLSSTEEHRSVLSKGYCKHYMNGHLSRVSFLLMSRRPGTRKCK